MLMHETAPVNPTVQQRFARFSKGVGQLGEFARAAADPHRNGDPHPTANLINHRFINVPWTRPAEQQKIDLRRARKQKPAAQTLPVLQNFVRDIPYGKHHQLTVSPLVFGHQLVEILNIDRDDAIILDAFGKLAAQPVQMVGGVLDA